MWWVQQVVAWLALGAALTAALNFLLMSRAPSPASRPVRQLLLPPASPPEHLEPLHQVYLKGEVYALRDSDYHRLNQRNRTGLSEAVQSLYSHLARVKAQFRTSSPHVTQLVHSLKQDLTTRRVTRSPWSLAKKWATPRSLVPTVARGLGDVLEALAHAPITSTHIGYKGTQLKLSVMLKGGQRAVFRPKRYSRGEVIEGEVYAGADRHNAEVAAFHLSRLLALPMVPITVGRRVSPKRHLLSVASRELAATFFMRKGGRSSRTTVGR